MERTMEAIDVPVPHVMEKTIEAVKLIPQERVQNCTVEQIIIDVPAVKQGRVPATQTLQKVLEESQVQFPSLAEEIVKAPKAHRQEEIMEQTAGKANALMNANHIAVETASQPFPTVNVSAESSVVYQSVPQPVSTRQATGPVVELDSRAAASAPSKREVRQPAVAVTNGRPSQTETDHVIQETRKCRDEDETNKSKIETMNGSKNHCVSMRNTLINERHYEFEAEHGEGLTHHVVDPSCRKRKGSDITQSLRVRAFTRTHDADDRREIFIGDIVSTDETEEDVCVHAVIPASSLAHGELDDTKSEMECLREELKEMKKMLQFLVRRERQVDVKTEVAAKKLQRLEKEREGEDDKERETSLMESLAVKTKVVKLVVDKWFVDKGFGFGKTPTGETVFIHASAVVGAEVQMIGTDAWVQVVNDDARAQGGIERAEPGDKQLGRRRRTGKGQKEWLSK